MVKALIQHIWQDWDYQAFHHARQKVFTNLVPAGKG